MHHDQPYNIYNPRPLSSPLQDASYKMQAEIFSKLQFEQEAPKRDQEDEESSQKTKESSPSQVLVSQDFYMIQDYIKKFSSHIPQQQSPQEAIKTKLKQPNYSIQDLIYVSTSKIDFETVLPGQVLESTLDIVNKTNKNIVVQIFVDCENPEFRDTKQYVYSIRRSHLLDFNDQHCLIMTPRSSASFHVTLKAPEVKKACKILGQIEVSILNFSGQYNVKLESTLAIPKIICPKSLFHLPSRCSIINFAFKKGAKMEFKLPLLFEGNLPMTVEFSFYDDHPIQDSGFSFSCSVSPKILTICEQEEESRSVNIIAKKRGTGQSQYIKKILVARIMETSLIYSFLLSFELY